MTCASAGQFLHKSLTKKGWHKVNQTGKDDHQKRSDTKLPRRARMRADCDDGFYKLAWVENKIFKIVDKNQLHFK